MCHAKSMSADSRPMTLLYVSGCTVEPWLTEKYAAALANGGEDVEIVLFEPSSSGEVKGLFADTVPVRRFGRRRLFSARTPLGLLRFAFHVVRKIWAFGGLLLYVLGRRRDCYVAADPRVLGICSLAARIHRARLVYIPHEYYPDLSYGSRRKRERFRETERRHVPRVSAAILLGDKLADEYRARYALGTRAHVVYTGWPAGPGLSHPVLRARLGLGPDHRIVLYVGVISAKRGLLNVVSAMPLLAQNTVFAILGYGSEVDQVRRHAESLDVADRVRIIPAVPQTELLAYAAGADVGVIPILNVCRSYDLCCPGKLFEYIAAGLPLAVSNLTQLESYVKTRGLGEVFDPEDPRDIARALRKLLDDEEYRRSCAERSRRVQREEACWEIQAARLRSAVFGLSETLS